MSALNDLANQIEDGMDESPGFIAWTGQGPMDLAVRLTAAGYRQIFDGDCGLSGVSDPSEREAAEAWMRWANLAMNDEIGAIGAMKQMLTELGYRKAEATK